MGIENYFVFIVTAGILAMTPGVVFLGLGLKIAFDKD